MRSVFRPILILTILSLQLPAQTVFHDSLKVVASSAEYDYKNPVFCLLPYESEWLAYERHQGNSSCIILRKYNYSGYGNEIVVSSGLSGINTNPSISGGLAVWQSDARGGFDIFFARQLNDSTWSAPALLDSSSTAETEPFILNNSTMPSQYNFSYLVYRSDNSIRFRRYKTLTQAWDNDTIVFSGSANTFTPILYKESSSSLFSICFLRKDPDNVSRFVSIQFSENYQGNPVVFGGLFELYSGSSIDDIRISFGFASYLSIPYDTLGQKHIAGLPYANGNSKSVFTLNVPGDHLSGKAAPIPLITNSPFYFFSNLSTVTRSNDSLFFTFVFMPSSFNTNPLYRRVYTGDTSFIPDYDVSAVLLGQGFYRVKTIRERKNGERTELVETYLQDMLNRIVQQSETPSHFTLHPNYPNPFNSETRIEYELRADEDVSLKVFDLTGKEVATLVESRQSQGFHSITFRADALSSGIYFCRLTSAGKNANITMLLLK